MRAQVALCYAAFALLRALCRRYARRYPTRPLSEDRLLRTLRRIEVSRVCDRGTGKWFFLPSKATHDAERIYRMAGLTLPGNAEPVPPPDELRATR